MKDKDYLLQPIGDVADSHLHLDGEEVTIVQDDGGVDRGQQ